MIDIETARQLVIQTVPFNHILGIQIEAIEPDRVELGLPEASNLLNHVGTVHAVAQYGLGEAASGTMTVCAFNDLMTAGVVPLAVEAHVRYRRPAQGALRGIATLSAQKQEDVRTVFAQTQRARFPVTVQVLTSQDVTAMELEITWMLLRQK
jgi:acyl-coenzyme A thioesterase PaaI-like protein